MLSTSWSFSFLGAPTTSSIGTVIFLPSCFFCLSTKLVLQCSSARCEHNATITGSISAYDGRCSCDCSDCWASWTPCGRERRPRYSGAESVAALCAVWGWASWKGFYRKRRRYSIHPVAAVGCRVTGAIISSRESPTVGLLDRHRPIYYYFFFSFFANERKGNADCFFFVVVNRYSYIEN